MAARDVVEDIRNKLKCGICLDVLRDARVLTCGHTFCFTCIEQAYNTSHLTMRQCPVCRESYFVQQQDIRNVRKNFSVNDVLETLQSAGPCRLCAICQDGDGACICLKCMLSLCKHCSRRTTINCSHQLLPFEDLNSKPFLREIIRRSKSKQTCPSHSDEDASCFCQTCKRVLCNACRLRDHVHHDTQGLQESVRNLRARDVPGLLGEKERKFDETKNSLMRQASSYASPPVEIQEKILRYESYRAECSELHEDMCHLFQFGSVKSIPELFHEREKKIDKIKSIPTESCFQRYMTSFIYMFVIAFRTLFRGSRGARGTADSDLNLFCGLMCITTFLKEFSPWWNTAQCTFLLMLFLLMSVRPIISSTDSWLFKSPCVRGPCPFCPSLKRACSLLCISNFGTGRKTKMAETQPY